MQLRREEVSRSSMDFIFNNLKSFLERDGLDFVYIKLGITFSDSSATASVSTVGHGLIFFKGGKKGSLLFDKICDFDHPIKNRESYVQDIIRNSLSLLNKGMFSYSGKYWRFVTIKIDNDGKIYVKFYYDLREGKGVIGHLEKFD